MAKAAIVVDIPEFKNVGWLGMEGWSRLHGSIQLSGGAAQTSPGIEHVRHMLVKSRLMNALRLRSKAVDTLESVTRRKTGTPCLFHTPIGSR